MKEISIVIIIKDDYKLLECALRSINGIEYPRSLFEVIVIDDGSSKPIQDRMSINFTYEVNFFYIPRTSSSCRSRARNIGADKTKFEYIMFMDGDHVVEPDILEKYSRYFSLQRNRRIVMGSRRATFREDSAKILQRYRSANSLPLEVRNRFVPDDRLDLLQKTRKSVKDFIGRWQLFWSCNFCIEKKLFIDIGGFDENFIEWGLEDTEFGYRLYIHNIEYDLMDNYIWHIYPDGPSPNLETTRYASWVSNLLYFYKKYDDLRILEQFEFENIFFYKTGIAQETNPTDVDWINSFLNFERKLTYIHEHQELFTFLPKRG